MSHHTALCASTAIQWSQANSLVLNHCSNVRERRTKACVFHSTKTLLNTHTHTFHKAQPTEQHLAMHSLLLLQSTARGGKRLAAVWHYGNASGGFSDSSPSMEMSVHEDEAITQLSELLLSFVLLRSLPGPKPVSSAKCWRAKGIQAVPFQLLSSQVFLILIFA